MRLLTSSVFVIAIIVIILEQGIVFLVSYSHLLLGLFRFFIYDVSFVFYTYKLIFFFVKIELINVSSGIA